MLDKNAIKQVDINNEAQAVHNLHNKKIEFVKLMSNYKVLKIVENLLKESTYKKLEEIICQKSFARNPSFNKKNSHYIQIVDLLPVIIHLQLMFFGF